MKNKGLFGYKVNMTLNYNKLFANLTKEIDVYNLGIITAVSAPSRLFSIKTAKNLVSLIRSIMQDYEIKIEPEDIQQFLIGFAVGIEAYWASIKVAVNWEILEEGEVLPDETIVWMNDGNELLTITVFSEE